MGPGPDLAPSVVPKTPRGGGVVGNLRPAAPFVDVKVASRLSILDPIKLPLAYATRPTWCIRFFLMRIRFPPSKLQQTRMGEKDWAWALRLVRGPVWP